MSSMAMDASRVLLSSAFFQTTSVTGSPAAAAETIIATLTIPQNIRADQRVYLFGWASLTVGTTGTALTYRLRQTNVAGTVVAASGALTAVAANLVAHPIIGIDSPGLQNNFVYVLTLLVTGGSAPSTVSAVGLVGLVV
jgi:hypothetical protein